MLTLAAAALTVLGGTIGGTLAYDYGFNVETAGDHPVWHRSETDVDRKIASSDTTSVSFGHGLDSTNNIHTAKATAWM